MDPWNCVYMMQLYIHKYIYKYVHKFMHMHMYHEYESVYEYGSNAFEQEVINVLHVKMLNKGNELANDCLLNTPMPLSSVFIAFTMLTSFLTASYCAALTDDIRLIQNLLHPDRYNPTIPPNLLTSDPVVVRLGLSLNSLINLVRIVLN